MPATTAAPTDVISSPSTNEIAAPTSHSEAGAANGKRCRPSSGRMRIAIAGTANHGDDDVCESSRRATSRDAAERRETIRASNPYLRASDVKRLTP